MLRLLPSVRILLDRNSPNARKRCDSPAQYVSDVLEQVPFSRHLVVFRDQRGDRLKILYEAGEGFAIWYPLLEKVTLRFPSPNEDEA